MIEIIQRRYDIIAVDTETEQRLGSWDPTAGANRGVVLGKYVQPETKKSWIKRVEALDTAQSRDYL